MQSSNHSHHHLDNYLPALTAAIRIPPPDDAASPAIGKVGDKSSRGTSGGGDAGKSSIYRSRLASFPPPSSIQGGSQGKSPQDAAAIAAQGGSKEDKPSHFSAASLSNGVADMFLSSILPSSIPKTAPTAGKRTSSTRSWPLTSQREPLALPAMTNNFRRFVARCGPVFWLQDRVEEVLFWKKPVWTWAYLLGWGFVCEPLPVVSVDIENLLTASFWHSAFYPRLLLIAPSMIIIFIILNQYERSHPSVSAHPATNMHALPATSSGNGSGQAPAPPATRSIFAKPLAATIAATLTSNTQNHHAVDESEEEHHRPHGTTVDEQGREIPAAPPGSAESGVDYYMNLQGIQNLMGVISDVHDAALPWVSLISPSLPNPAPAPTTFPLSPTHLLILMLVPSLALPLLPASALPWIMLSIGYLPTIVFHPAFDPAEIKDVLSRHTTRGGVRAWRATLERKLLTDRLDDHLAKSEIREVHVWEHERLDPGWWKQTVAKVMEGKQDVPGALETPPESAWSGKYLKSTDRQPWVRALPKDPRDNLWEEETVPREKDGGAAATAAEREGGRVSLRLVNGWSFVPGEEWRVDYAAKWAKGAADESEHPNGQLGVLRR